VRICKTHFEIVLDYSVDSIRALDRVIDDLRERGIGATDSFVDVVLALGAYFGEVIRRQYPNVIWIKDHPQLGEDLMALSLDGFRDCIFPMSMCQKRLLSEDEDTLWQKYDVVFVNPIHPPPLPETHRMPPPLPSP
jgi:hypothetical protein